MKLAIISDTHDNTQAVTWIIKYLNDHKIETAFHAGDLINPGILRRFADHYKGHLHFVYGNNDGELVLSTQLAERAPNITCHNRELVIEIEGKKMYMIHYSSTAELVAQSGKFDVVIGGHDHQYRVTEYSKTIFINPGNTVTHDEWINDSDKNTQNTFVVLDVDNLDTELVVVEG